MTQRAPVLMSFSMGHADFMEYVGNIDIILAKHAPGHSLCVK